jgi:hypothetical protein
MLLLETRTTHATKNKTHATSFTKKCFAAFKKWQFFHILELHICQMIAIETINILEIM